METEAIRVSMLFRQEVDPEIYERLAALPTGRARTVFLSRLILAGLDIHKRKGLAKPARKDHPHKVEPKVRTEEKEKSATDLKKSEPVVEVKPPIQARVEVASIPSDSVEDDFTKEFVKGLGGVPKR